MLNLITILSCRCKCVFSLSFLLFVDKRHCVRDLLFIIKKLKTIKEINLKTRKKHTVGHFFKFETCL